MACWLGEDGYSTWAFTLSLPACTLRGSDKQQHDTPQPLTLPAERRMVGRLRPSAAPCIGWAADLPAVCLDMAKNRVLCHATRCHAIRVWRVLLFERSAGGGGG